MLHGVDNPKIIQRLAIRTEHRQRKIHFSAWKSRFKGSLDYEEVSAELLKVTKTKKTELLIPSIILSAKNGGRCASVVPRDGVLFGSQKQHKEDKRNIENEKLEAIISMPSGVIEPYAGVSTA